jgi:hypothetical protein
MPAHKPGTGPSSPGGRHLEEKSALAKVRQSLPKFNDILIVEDDALDAKRMQGTLRSLFGYDVQMRVASTLGKALDAVIERKPDVVFLDDHLKPKDNAAETIPPVQLRWPDHYRIRHAQSTPCSRTHARGRRRCDPQRPSRFARNRRSYRASARQLHR